MKQYVTQQMSVDVYVLQSFIYACPYSSTGLNVTLGQRSTQTAALTSQNNFYFVAIQT